MNSKEVRLYDFDLVGPMIPATTTATTVGAFRVVPAGDLRDAHVLVANVCHECSRVAT